MRRHSLGVLAVLVGFCLTACDDDLMTVGGPPVFAQKVQIHFSALTASVDASRTYYHPQPVFQPELLLRALWEKGFRPRTAWQPLVEGALPCLIDLTPSSFTVELDVADARILEHGFVQGTEGLECFEVYMSYHVVE
jgi:hypothetical protein